MIPAYYALKNIDRLDAMDDSPTSSRVSNVQGPTLSSVNEVKRAIEKIAVIC